MTEPPRCGLCPRNCRVDRTAGERGWCGGGPEMDVASVVVHTGEEPFLTGDFGVGNVFFSGCNMACVFCQNHQISTQYAGNPRSPFQLAEILVRLQERGCPTVGLVSPTHILHRVREALVLARERGLTVPVIWNSNGYQSVSALKTLDGLVDIYLPDLKYADDRYADEYSKAPGYARVAREAVREMFRQVGNLRVEDGVAVGGLCVRHLVLPNDIAGTGETLRFLAGVSKDITISLMSQYNPVFSAGNHPLLSRRLRASEYWNAVEAASDLGLVNTLIQEPETSPDSHLPDFQRADPFLEN